MPVSDYRNLKTPFFDIKIGDSSGQRMVSLPHHILRLVEKIEILETFQPGEFSKITLTFIEGSREPGSPDVSQGTKGLYQLGQGEGGQDLDISGSLTNRTGIITDLRFSGTSGITFTTQEEVANNRIRNTKIVNVEGKSTTRKHEKEASAPIFLFQERNQVQVTWGYKEDNNSTRSIRGYVVLVETTFPDKGHPTTVVNCLDTGAFLDQMAAPKGIPFGSRINTDTGFVVEFNDLETDELIRKICNDAGLPCIISRNLPDSRLNKGRQKVWIGGESFHQFMTRLAEAHNAYYKVFPDPKTGKDTLVFIKDTDFESDPVVKNPTLFNYKAPGSILKSVSIRADFGTIGTVSHSTVSDENAEVVNQSTQTGEEFSQLFEARSSKAELTKIEEHVDLDYLNNNPIQACVGVKAATMPNSTPTGILENNPATGDESSLSEGAKVDSTIANKNAISMDMVTIGTTSLTPGLVELRGVGQRYSGKYRLLTVTHIIDSSGYNCRATGITYALAKGGIGLPEATKTLIEPQEESQLFEPKREDNTEPKGKAVRKEYSKLLGTPSK